MSHHDVVIVGAGMAGLAAARRLREKGHEPLVLEADDGPGGRVRTDVVDGFQLDRGFQVLLTAYPEARRVLDMAALDLHEFEPGALVRVGNRFHRVSDPVRSPGDVFSTLRSPVGSLTDKLTVLRYRRRLLRTDVGDLFTRSEVTARQRLEDIGFSERMIERLLGPLFTGAALDPTLSFSSRYLEFMFRMLCEGVAAVPALGMGAIATQLAADLPGDTIRYDQRVETTEADHVMVDGEKIRANAVVVATGLSDAAELTDGIDDRGWLGATTWWFAADEAPIHRPVLALGGSAGPLNSVAVLSQVCSSYAPGGRALIAASCASVELDESRARRQLTEWFGPVVDSWQTLRTDRVERARPRQPVGLDPDQRVRLSNGLFVAGDHRQNSSINGALVSGRRAGDAVAARLCRSC
ncbi:MAG: NAD(P)/FAD-dependent oxidoreductase [Acidimicrobiales bacterium]